MIMFQNPDDSRKYLIPYLYKLATLCSDARSCFLMLLESTDQLMQRPPMPRPPDFWPDMKEFQEIRKRSQSIHRITLSSFILISANISKIIWPHTETKQPLKSRRQKRRDHLKKFFPSDSYPNLRNKDFRNFIEHFDDRLDQWDETSDHHNISMGSIGMTKDAIKGKVTIWDNFDPHSFTITYYHEEKGTESTNLKSMYEEIIKLHHEIPKPLAEIEDGPLDHFDFIFDL